MTIYTGSNYGFISTANSGSGTLTNPADKTAFSYENVQNYINGSFLLNLSGNGNVKVTIYFSNDNSGTVVSSQQFIFNNTTSQQKSFQISGQFLKMEIESIYGGTTYNIQTRFNNSGESEKEVGFISAKNSYYTSSAVLASATPLSGDYEDISNYSLIVIMATAEAASSPADGTFTAIFSQDGVNVDRQITYSVQDATANGTSGATNSLTFNPPHTLIPICRYFKLQYTNGSQALTALRVTTQYHFNKSKALTSRATQQLSDLTDADTIRAILTGRLKGTTLPQGRYENITTTNGNLNVEVASPNTAFGEIQTSSNTPEQQVTFYDGVPLDTTLIKYNSEANTSYTTSEGFIILDAQQISASIPALIEVSTREFVKYKSGQGIDARFSAQFSEQTSGIIQFAGLYNQEDSITFGYYNTVGGSEPTDFAIRFSVHGKQQVNTYTVIAATNTGTYNLLFDSETIAVSITSGDSAVKVAELIASAVNADLALNTYGWNAQYYEKNSTQYVQFVRTHSSSTQVIITVPAQLPMTAYADYSRAGISPTITYYTQDDWNIDRCKTQPTLTDAYNYNPSGFNFDPTKGNVFKIMFQYLGFGAITFFIENSETGLFMPVHQIKYANSNTRPSIGNPNFRVTHSVINYTTTTGKGIRTASQASFVQGNVKVSPILRSFQHIIEQNTGTDNEIKRVILAISGRNLFMSNNNNFGTSSVNISVNRNNILIVNMGISLRTTSKNSGSLVVSLIKNPTSIQNYVGNNPENYLDWKADDNNLVYTLKGTKYESTTTGTTIAGGDTLGSIPISENLSFGMDLTPYNIFMTPDDTYALIYYSDYVDSSFTFDITGTLAWKINM